MKLFTRLGVAALAAAACIGLAASANAAVCYGAETFTVRNFSGHTIVAIDMVGAVTGERHANNGYIPPGYQKTYNFDDGTGYVDYRLRALLDNGQVVWHDDPNICVLNVWTISGY